MSEATKVFENEMIQAISYKGELFLKNKDSQKVCRVDTDYPPEYFILHVDEIGCFDKAVNSHERLREALEQIANLPATRPASDATKMKLIARAALEDSK